MKKQFIAVDDELLALDDLMNAISQAAPEAEVRGFRTPTEAIKAVSQQDFCPQVAFLDIQMRGVTGLELALELKKRLPAIEIIFVTAYPQYALESYSLHARGYLLKPVSADAVKKELEIIFGSSNAAEPLLEVKCFGNFEVFFEGRPLKFSRAKSKELFAYLVYRNGASCSIKEIAGIIFEDQSYDSTIKNQIQTFKSDMMKVLRSIGREDVIIKEHNCLSVDTSKISCDYYGMLKGGSMAAKGYAGEFMAQYSWAEAAAAMISRDII